ncbi:MAG: acetylornithine/succinylornithine family transaminase [Verrucomicrobiota bacterium JB023]|nr:acetylornithine/succinylornithine family transaminase [Verrucomicrobiota bacterium JB023]
MNAPLMPTYARFPLTVSKGKGSRVWDEGGKAYLDFCSGIAVCSLGHCPDVLTKVLSEQASQLVHVSNLYYNKPAARLATLLVELVEIPGKVFFCNSGAEANDGLIKLARRFGRHCPNPTSKEPRFEIITFNRSFHGRTLGGIAATGQQKIKEGFDPLLPGFRHVPLNNIESLRDAIGENTCAILMEPIQGEGGVNQATPEFLQAVRKECQSHNLLLMLDEVQCGFGRLGEMMGWRAIAPDLEPDAVSWAKGMGGGLPVGGFWANDRAVDEDGTELSSLLGPGTHGSTYGGNPLISAGSHAVLSEIREKNLPANAAEREAQIRSVISDWKHPAVREVRGRGLLLGLALNVDSLKHAENSTASAALCRQLMENGLLVPPAGPDVIRFLPALTVTEDEVTEALAILKTTLDGMLVSQA